MERGSQELSSSRSVVLYDHLRRCSVSGCRERQLVEALKFCKFLIACFTEIKELQPAHILKVFSVCLKLLLYKFERADVTRPSVAASTSPASIHDCLNSKIDTV